MFRPIGKGQGCHWPCSLGKVEMGEESKIKKACGRYKKRQVWLRLIIN